VIFIKVLTFTQYAAISPSLSPNKGRTRDGREVDFAISKNGELETILEVKLSDTSPSRSLRFFKEMAPASSAIQLVHNARNYEEIDGISSTTTGCQSFPHDRAS
jgi:hypothetical protein